MKKNLISIIMAAIFSAGACSSFESPFKKESFKSQENSGILGMQTVTYLNANGDKFLDRVIVKEGNVFYQEGTFNGYSKPLSIMEFGEDENPVGVLYSGNKLSVHTTKGVHTFRKSN